MRELPLNTEGFDLFRSGPDTLLVRKEDSDRIRRALTNGEGCVPVRLGGRGRLGRFPLGEGHGLVRKYRRGGWLRFWIRESYLDNRPLYEFKVHREAAERGVPVPELLGVVYRRVGPWYRGAFATREIDGDHLLNILNVEPGDMKRELEAAGRAVFTMHDKGIDHADLQLMNLLWDGEGIVILDLDKARVSDGLSEAERTRNLERLRRSFRKHGFGSRFAEFQDAYTAARDEG